MHSHKLLLSGVFGALAPGAIPLISTPAAAACYGTNLFPCNPAGYYSTSFGAHHHHHHRSYAAPVRTYYAPPTVSYYYPAPVARDAGTGACKRSVAAVPIHAAQWPRWR